MCVRSIAYGGQWEGVEARGGARLSSGTYPDPPHAMLPTHISLPKKSLHFVWPGTYGHHWGRRKVFDGVTVRQCRVSFGWVLLDNFRVGQLQCRTTSCISALITCPTRKLSDTEVVRLNPTHRTAKLSNTFRVKHFSPSPAFVFICVSYDCFRSKFLSMIEPVSLSI